MEQKIELRADRKAWLIIIICLVINCFVIATTRQMEVSRIGSGDSGAVIWMFEATSHAVILVVAGIIPKLLSAYPLSALNWTNRIPIYGFGFLVFAVAHILLMVGLRFVLYPLIGSGPYHFGLLSWEPWVYEIRKDFLTYVTVLSIFLIARHLGQLRLEADTARQDARETGRIALPSGGRTIFLDAVDIRYVKAAGNYVEVFTSDNMYLIRATLSSVERLLDAAGQHIRIHRSYLVNRHAIEVLDASSAGKVPGDMSVTLTGDTTLPVSRKYRTPLETSLAKA